MYGTAEFQVTAQTDGKMIQIAVEAADGLQVGQGLGGMLMSTVTGIDHGDQGFLRGYHGSTFLGMAHSADVRIAGDDADSIGYTFSLGCGRAGSIGEADDSAA